MTPLAAALNCRSGATETVARQPLDAALMRVEALPASAHDTDAPHTSRADALVGAPSYTVRWGRMVERAGYARGDVGWERGLPRAADTGASGPAITPDERQLETPKGVAWSHPCRGITGDLGGPLSEPTSPAAKGSG